MAYINNKGNVSSYLPYVFFFFILILPHSTLRFLHKKKSPNQSNLTVKAQSLTRLKLPKVAVVGCGLAGALSALELAHRKAEVTVYERAERCGHGTSGRIAGEMMFYFFAKASLGWPKPDLWAVYNKGHIQATFGGFVNFVRFYTQASPRGSTKRITITCTPAKTTECMTFVFLPGRFGPKMKEEVRYQRTTIPKGSQIEMVVSKGPPYDRALSPYEIGEWSKQPNAQGKWIELLSSNYRQGRDVEVTFWVSGDARSNIVAKAEFFQEAYNKMKDFLNRNPELCEAVVSDACCIPDSNARRWVENNYHAAQYKCEDGGRFGTAHVFHDRGLADPILAHLVDERISDRRFDAWSWADLVGTLPNLVPQNRTGGGGGAAFQREMGGYVRTEVLFPRIQETLQEMGVQFHFNSEPAAYQVVEDGVEMSVHARIQTWEKLPDPKDPGKTGILTLTGQFRSQKPTHSSKFDHVVIATGAAINDGLSRVDPNLARRDLFPVFGYVVVGEQVLIPQEQERKTGVVDDDYHQYIRSTKTGAVAMGGGMSLSSSDDATIEALAYDPKFADTYMAQSVLGRKLLADPGITRQGGVRPASKYEEFPMLKSDPSGRIIINTGGGAFGYSIYWKSAELVAEMVYGQGRPHANWAHAVQSTAE